MRGILSLPCGSWKPGVSSHIDPEAHGSGGLLHYWVLQCEQHISTASAQRQSVQLEVFIARNRWSLRWRERLFFPAAEIVTSLVRIVSGLGGFVMFDLFVCFIVYFALFALCDYICTVCFADLV